MKINDILVEFALPGDGGFDNETNIKEGVDNLNDDDWYEIAADAKSIVGTLDQRPQGAVMGRPVKLPNGNYAIKGMQAKHMGLQQGMAEAGPRAVDDQGNPIEKSRNYSVAAPITPDQLKPGGSYSTSKGVVTKTDTGLIHKARSSFTPKPRGVEEAANDYFKRRRDEEDRIAGTKPPAKRTPKQTDYEKKRKEQGVAEAAKWRDPKYQGKTFDYDDSYEGPQDTQAGKVSLDRAGMRQTRTFDPLEYKAREKQATGKLTPQDIKYATARNFGQEKQQQLDYDRSEGVAEAADTPQQKQVRAAIAAGLAASQRHEEQNPSATSTGVRQGGAAGNIVDMISRIDPDGTIVMVPAQSSGNIHVPDIKRLLAFGGMPGAKIVDYSSDQRADPQNAQHAIWAKEKQAQGMAVIEQQKDTSRSGPPEADYGDDYQQMVLRLKKLAGAGPLKTVYDPQKRVYRNVPTAVQPKKEQR